MELYTPEECVWVTYEWAVRYWYYDGTVKKHMLIDPDLKKNPYPTQTIPNNIYSLPIALCMPKSMIIQFLKYSWFDGDVSDCIVEVNIYHDIVYPHIYNLSRYSSYYSKDGLTGVFVNFE